MAKKRLDPKLIEKIEKNGIKNVNVRISQRATQLGISSEAALILIAKQCGIGTNVYQKKLTPSQQSEVRENIRPNIISSKHEDSEVNGHTKQKYQVQLSERILIKSSIDYIIKDPELIDRCIDLLTAKKNFDRAINQATLILEDRIRKKSNPPSRMVGVILANYAFNSDLNKTILKISDNPDEQDGFCNIIRGIMLSFRNLTHHHIVNNFSREYALSVCSFIDVLLQVVNNSQKIH